MPTFKIFENKDGKQHFSKISKYRFGVFGLKTQGYLSLGNGWSLAVMMLIYWLTLGKVDHLGD